MPGVDDLTIEIYADGADLDSTRQLAADPLIKGFTTNQTHMRKAGVTDVARFARALLEVVDGRPVSFEVLSDDEAEMERQACQMAAWGPEVFVKIPVTDTRGRPLDGLVRRLAASGVQVNVTALLTLGQVEWVAECLRDGPPSFVPVFAGRIADTGVDPLPTMRTALELLADQPQCRLIWASPREVLNVVQADAIGCHVITVTHDLLAKLHLLGHDLDRFSLETVEMFQRDADAAGYALPPERP